MPLAPWSVFRQIVPSAERFSIACLVALLAVCVTLGPKTRWPQALILCWSALVGVACACNLLDFGCCCKVNQSTASTKVQESLLRLGGQNELLPELRLDNLSTDDALVLTCAVSEFGRHAGLRTLALVRCPTINSQQWKCIFGPVLECSKLQLQTLDLSGNPGVDDSVVCALTVAERSALSELKELRLADCALTTAGIGALSGWLNSRPLPAPDSSFPDAHAGGNSKDSGFHVPPVAAEPTSTTKAADVLGLNAPPFDAPPLDVGTLDLGSEGHPLQVLSLSGNTLVGSGKILARLVRAQNLQELELQDCGLCADDVSRLAAALPKSQILRLDLAKNKLTSKELSALTPYLEFSKVVDLGLEDNELGRGSALNGLAESSRRRPLQRLRLRGNRLSERELVSFESSLRLHRQLAPGTKEFLCRAGCECNGRGEVM